MITQQDLNNMRDSIELVKDTETVINHIINPYRNGRPIPNSKSGQEFLEAAKSAKFDLVEAVESLILAYEQVKTVKQKLPKRIGQ